MNLLLGFLGLSINLLVVVFLIKKNKQLLCILPLALFLRIFFVLINNYVFTLPDGSVDAISFEEIGWLWNVNNQLFFEKFLIPSTFFYSWIIGFIYSITDRSVLLIQSLSVLMGVGIVYISWKFGRLLFNEGVAKKAALILSLHPVLVMYSALTMREVFITFFLLLSIYKFTKWYLNRQTMLLSSFFFAMVAMTFHGAMFILLPIYALIIFWDFIRKKRFSFFLSTTIIIMFSITLLFLLTYFEVSVPKFHSVASAINPERWISEIKNRSIGGSAYPDYLNVTATIDLLWAIPVRFFYFMFSPFVWDIRSFSHLFGLIDALFYIYIFTSSYINRGLFLKRRVLLYILFILFSIAFVFSIGTGNFGSAVRHRAKLLPLFVILFSAINNKRKNND
jgi:4-amino-4-deoxy-L-arabinose transferase-like glycosyltransferase